MICFVVIIFAHVLLETSACPDPITTVHIQNHDGPIYLSPDRFSCDNQMTHGNRGTTGNQAACSNRACYDKQPQLLHNSNCHVCETDCKCVTKLSTCVPINTVTQSMCTPGSYYSYPEYSYGYGCYPESYGSTDRSSDACPIVSDGLIPLLKSYIGQCKCPKHSCQCGHSY